VKEISPEILFRFKKMACEIRGRSALEWEAVLPILPASPSLPFLANHGDSLR
jgi:hypothetical protein